MDSALCGGSVLSKVRVYEASAAGLGQAISVFRVVEPFRMFLAPFTSSAIYRGSVFGIERIHEASVAGLGQAISVFLDSAVCRESLIGKVRIHEASDRPSAFFWTVLCVRKV